MTYNVLSGTLSLYTTTTERYLLIVMGLLHGIIRVPTLLDEKKIPGVLQSSFRIFEVLLVTVCNRISNTFDPQ